MARQRKWTQDRIEVEARALLRRFTRYIIDYDEECIPEYILLAYLEEDDIETSPWISYLLSQYIDGLKAEYYSIPKPCYRVVQFFDKVLDNKDTSRKRGVFSTALTLDAAIHFYENTAGLVRDGRNVAILSVDHKQAEYAINLANFMKCPDIKLLYENMQDILSVDYKVIKNRIKKEREQILVFNPDMPMYNFDFIPLK